VVNKKSNNTDRHDELLSTKDHESKEGIEDR
jgi:hypothetical protein